MKNRNWFWGFFFLLAAIFVIASQTGFFGQIGVMSILATVLLVALVIAGVAERNYFGMFLSLGFLYMIYRDPFGLPHISLWLLFLAAMLASIGFSMIFQGHPHRNWQGGDFIQTSENMDDNNPYAKVSFGSSIKYLHGNCLKSGQFYASFGELQLFFDQAQLSPDGAEIFVDCSFATIKMYVPRSWYLIDHTHVSLGSVENDFRMSQSAENAPRLTLSGNVSFGSVEIHYI